MNIKVFILVSVLFLSPILVSAAGLVPCGGSDEPMCTTEHVVAMVSGLINFLIAMLGVIAVIVLVITGAKLVTSAGNESEWESAKKSFTSIVIGIIIILAAWLVIDTVLQGLTGKGLDEWSGGLSDVPENTDSPSGSYSGTVYGFEERGGAESYRVGSYTSLEECISERNKILAEYSGFGGATPQITSCHIVE